MSNKPQSPFAEQLPESRFRISFLTLLLIFVIVAIMATSLLYASKSSLISREIYALFGVSVASDDINESRGFHLAFLLFCYSMPLLLTGILGLGRSGLLFLESWTNRSEEDVEDAVWEDRNSKSDSDTIGASFRITRASNVWG